MNKIIPFPIPGSKYRAPPVGRRSPSAAEFETAAAAFLKRTFPAASFLEVCNAAIENAFNERSEKALYKYKYLACMALERYYDASLLAFVMLNRFQDEALHCEMMCSICLKRNHYDMALEHLDRLIGLSGRFTPEAAELERDKAALKGRIAMILRFSSESFLSEVGNDNNETRRRYAGLPLLLTGPARFLLHPDTGTPYFIFKAEGKTGRVIYGQARKSEIPFIPRFKTGGAISIMGSFLGADEEKILLQPCTYIGQAIRI